MTQREKLQPRKPSIGGKIKEIPKGLKKKNRSIVMPHPDQRLGAGQAGEAYQGGDKVSKN